MNKLDNYIYLTICEVAIEEMKKTSYVSFPSFCNGMYFSLKQGSLSHKEMCVIIKINELMDKIYSMDEVTTANYIVEFFSLDREKLTSFQHCIIATKKIYPLCFN